MGTGYPDVAAKDRKVSKIAIVGPMNAGKSQLFNMLTHSYSDVSNYPHTTVGVMRAHASLNGRRYEVWDTPGISSPTMSFAEEKFTRDALTRGKPDFLLFVGDALHLKRSLALLSQVMEFGAPCALILSKVEAAAKKGVFINEKALARDLNIPVIMAATSSSVDVEKIEAAILENSGTLRLPAYPAAIERVIDDVTAAFGPSAAPSRGLTLLFLQKNQEARAALAEIDEPALRRAYEAEVKFFRRNPSLNVGQAVFAARESWADALAEANVTAVAVAFSWGFSQKAAWASRHPVWGWPILLAVFWVTFKGVGGLATGMAAALDAWIFVPLTTIIGGMITYDPLREFMVGNFGVLTMGVMNAIGTVVPILIVFFLIVSVLEDVGYLSNLAVLLNRLFSKFGLTGKAALSMSLGFGCNTMATLTSRMLETRRERVIASFLIALGVPCAVQLGVMIAILSTAPFSSLVLVVGTVLATQIVFGLALNKMLTTEQPAEFIIELPPFKTPDMRNVLRKTYFRVKSFLNEALPLFVISAMLMFGLEKTGLLSLVKAAARPVVTGLLSMPDKATEVFILVLSRRELGAVYFKGMVDARELDYFQIVVGLTVMTLFIPCMSNTVMMARELGVRSAVYINSAIIVIAIAVGAIMNLSLRMVVAP